MATRCVPKRSAKSVAIRVIHGNDLNDSDDDVYNLNSESEGSNESSEEENEEQTDTENEQQRRAPNIFVFPQQSHDNHPEYSIIDGWSVAHLDIDRRPMPLPIFTDREGLLIPMPRRPVEFIFSFITDGFCDTLANWANNKASLNPTLRDKYNKKGNRSHQKQWEDITRHEMKQFIGMVFCMGLIKKPQMQDYFSTNYIIETPFFRRSDNLSRDRFMYILKYLRFYDCATHDIQNHGKLGKVNPGMKMIIDIVKTIYRPGRKISLDEYLMLYKGRLHLKQYIKTKRARFGVKAFSLNAKNGFTYDVEIYQGSHGVTSWADGIPDAENLTSSERIVVELVNRCGFLQTGRMVTVDNWFCSLRLANFLDENQTLLQGTIRSNRGPPRELVNFQMNPIDVEFARKGNVLIAKFVDKRTVYLLSTSHDAETVEKTRRVNQNQTRNFHKPSVIESYNYDMDGTDKVDAMQQAINCARKSYVWHKKVGLFNLQRLCLVNAFILSREFFPDVMKHVTLAQYCLWVIQELVYGQPQQPQVQRQRQIHRLQKFTATGRNPRPTKPCCQCKKVRVAGRVSESRYFCAECPGRPAIHMDCFEAWHT